MNPLFERRQLHPVQREELRRVLLAGPWCWPLAFEDRALALAREVTGLAGPPLVPVGVAPLLAVRDDGASLWALCGQCCAERDVVTFDDEALEQRRLAASVLPRAVPVLWRSVRRAAEAAPRARFVDQLPRPDCLPGLAKVLTDRSFGLAFLLAFASEVLERPLPGDVAASAVVLDGGELRGVEALGEKVRLVVERAPRVERLLVAPGQAEAARAASRGSPLRIVEVRNAAEAIAEVFEAGELEASLAEAFADAGRRAVQVEAFFRLAVGERSQMVAWPSVARAAEVLLESPTAISGGASPDELALLTFTRMVALRHEGRSAGDLGLPPAELVDRLPQPQRVDLVAHLVQQACEPGFMTFEEAKALYDRHGRSGLDAFPAHLKLQGAFARLLASTGRHEEALELQREAARGFLDRGELEQCTYPLSEWLRLAGALEDAGSYELALDCLGEAEARGGLGRPGSSYVELARLRAEVVLGRGERLEQRAMALVVDGALDAHVRESARRWLRCARGSSGHELPVPELPQSSTSAMFEALERLDEATHVRRLDDVSTIVEALRAGWPHLIEPLVEASSRVDLPAGEYIGRFFPF